MNKEIYYCPDCKLYWFKCEDGMTEFRLYMFVPINPKKCKFCSDPSIEVPKELIEFRKKLEIF